MELGARIRRYVYDISYFDSIPVADLKHTVRTIFWYQQLYQNLYSKRDKKYNVNRGRAEDMHIRYFNGITHFGSKELYTVAFISVFMGVAELEAHRLKGATGANDSYIERLANNQLVATKDRPVDLIMRLFTQRILSPQNFSKSQAYEIYENGKVDEMLKKMSHSTLLAEDLELLFMHSVIAADRVEIEDGVIKLYSDEPAKEEESKTQSPPLPAIRRF